MPGETSNQKTAWGDESARMLATPPMYLLGATIFTDNPYESLQKLRSLTPPGAKKLHWRDLGRSVQKRSLETIAQMKQTTHIVVATPMKGNKQERARRKCLQKMLVELERQDVDRLVLESRKPVLNKKDIDFLLYLRRSHAIAKIELEHTEAHEDPRILVPDQILGAFGETNTNDTKERSWATTWKEIGEQLVIHKITV